MPIWRAGISEGADLEGADLARADLAAAKASLRARVLARRRATDPDDRTAAGRQLRDAVLELPEMQMAGTVAAYVSVGTEPDTRGLLFALVEARHVRPAPRAAG